MDFGIALPTAADSWKVTQRAEELGFTHAWFYDTQMLSADCFVAMGAAAVNTRRIRLGTGVLVPSNRIAPVAANALATLNQLAPGRIDFGVGTGFTARRAMGFGAMKVKDMETYIAQVYGLLRRETVDFEMEGQQHKIRFLNPELPLFNTRDPIALHLSAFGPRTRGNSGVIDELFPRILSTHTILVPKVDRVGNDVAGVRHPLVEAPVATLTGWNTRRAEFGGNDLCDLLGSTIALKRTKDEAVNDARPSLAELYGDHDDYVHKIEQAARALETRRLMLPEDVDLTVREAQDSDVLK